MLMIIVVLQDSYSVYKTEFLVRNIDCRDTEKFVFVCNKFRRDTDNDYLSSTIGQQFILTEYVEEVPAYKQHNIEIFADLKGIRNLAYLFS